MLRLRNVQLACAAVLLLLPACSPPSAPATLAASNQAAAPWRNVDENTRQIADLPGLIALAAAFPESASVQRRLLSAAVRDQDRAVARAALARLEAMGYALRPQSFDALAPLIGEAEADAARILAGELSRQAGVSLLFSTIPADHRLIEGLAWDRQARRLFASSVVDRRLIAIDAPHGSEILDVDGGSLFGLAIDQPRRLLWIASGIVEQTPSPDTAFRGLIAVDLDSGSVVRRVSSPAREPVGVEGDGNSSMAPSLGPSLSDVAVGADGTVYASDPTGGGVYRLLPDEPVIETLIAPGVLRSPQGIAVHPSGERIYVSDYGYGIALFDLVQHKIARLDAASAMMLDGTDGLYWFNEGLVAIQNGSSPMRIVRISLDPTGKIATGLTVVEANHPAWGEPTNGQVIGNDLIYVSEPQWERFGPGGAVKGEEPLRPNRIRAAPLAHDGSPKPTP